jgi:hypothetical protein
MRRNADNFAAVLGDAIDGPPSPFQPHPVPYILCGPSQVPPRQRSIDTAARRAAEFDSMPASEAAPHVSLADRVIALLHIRDGMSAEELRYIRRTFARQYHPDLHPGICHGTATECIKIANGIIDAAIAETEKSNRARKTKIK